MSYWHISSNLFTHRVEAPCLTDISLPISLHTGWRHHVLLTHFSLQTERRHHVLLTHLYVLMMFELHMVDALYFTRINLSIISVTQGRDTRSYWHISLMEVSCLTDKQLSIIPILYKGDYCWLFLLIFVWQLSVRLTCDQRAMILGRLIPLFQVIEFYSKRNHFQLSGEWVSIRSITWKDVFYVIGRPWFCAISPRGRHSQVHTLMSLWCHHVKCLILTLWFVTSRGLNATESVADPGGEGVMPPGPVKISHKKDGH